VNRRAAALVAASAVGALAFATPGLAGSEYKNKYPDVTQSVACGDDGDVVTYAGPLKMWPPNHKLQLTTVTATEGEDGDPLDEVTLELVPDVLDAAGGDGGPNHDPDFAYAEGDATPGMASGTGSAAEDLFLRAERSGKGEGRVYTITFNATFDNGLPTEDCTGSFTVEVPHDMRGGADWK
jgi:hypothetical protein